MLNLNHSNSSYNVGVGIKTRILKPSRNRANPVPSHVVLKCKWGDIVLSCYCLARHRFQICDPEQYQKNQGVEDRIVGTGALGGGSESSSNPFPSATAILVQSQLCRYIILESGASP